MHQIISHSKSFPSMGSKKIRIVEVKNLPQNGPFCLPLFPFTQVCTVVTAKFAISSYFSKMHTVFLCYLALKWAIGKSSGLSNPWHQIHGIEFWFRTIWFQKGHENDSIQKITFNVPNFLLKFLGVFGIHRLSTIIIFHKLYEII